MTSTVPLPMELPAGQHRAHWLIARRFLARCVDAFTVLFLTFAMAVSVLVTVMDRLTASLDLGPWGASLAPVLLYALLGAVYETVFVARSGQTPGKDLLNLRVVDVTTGQPPSWRASAGRASCLLLARLVPGVAAGTVAPLAFAAWLPVGDHDRAVHDRLCHTRVEFFDAEPAMESDADQTARHRSASTEIDAIYGPRSAWRQLTGWLVPGGRH